MSPIMKSFVPLTLVQVGSGGRLNHVWGAGGGQTCEEAELCAGLGFSGQYFSEPAHFWQKVLLLSRQVSICYVNLT